MKRFLFLLLLSVAALGQTVTPGNQAGQLTDNKGGAKFAKELGIPASDAATWPADVRDVHLNVLTGRFEVYYAGEWQAYAKFTDLSNYLALTGGNLAGNLYTTNLLPNTTSAYDIGSATFYYHRAYLNYIYTTRISNNSSGNGIVQIGVANFNPVVSDVTDLGTQTTRFDELYINSIYPNTIIKPLTNNAVPLGESTLRFSNIFAQLGNFAGQVTVPTATVSTSAVPLSQVNTIVSGYLPLTGGTLSGTVTAPSYDSFKIAAMSSSSRFVPDVTRPSDSPIASEVYHDLLAFNRHWSTPSFQTSADGVTWNIGTLNNNLFNQKERQSIVYDVTAEKYLRWTWNHTQVGYSFAKWLKINWAYYAGVNSRNVVLESSSDGTTWTARHSSVSTLAATPEFFYINDWGGDTYVRLTLTNNGTANIALSAVKILTARAGDQGAGKEYESPYDWDASRNITFAGYVKNSSIRSNGGGLNFANTSGTTWGSFDETSGKLTLNNAPTAGSNEAFRAVDGQFAVPSSITVTSAYTTGTARTVYCQGTLTVTLATTVPDGMEYTIINETGAGTVTINVSGGGTINGVTSQTLTGTYKYMRVNKKGSNYIIVGQ